MRQAGPCIYRVLVVVAFLVFAAATLAVPFVYETQTLWYKVGVHKTMLRVGQLAGLLALFSLQAQVLLGARVAPLEKLFGIPPLMRMHRANGLLIAALALLHAALILVPEGITNLPVGWKFWPEQLGALLLVILLATVFTAQFRRLLGFAYQPWRSVHRWVGYVAVLLAALHVLYVSESFAGGLPRKVLFIVVAGVLAWLVGSRLAVRR